MKKRLVKLLALAMALLLAVSMSVGAYAFDGDYFDTTECWDYTEEETVIGNSVEAVVGTEINPDENAAGVNNYNVYAVEMDIQGMDTQALYDSMVTSFESEFKNGVQSQYNSLGWSVEFVSFETSVAYDSWELYQFVLMKSEQRLTYDTGNTVTLYQNMAIFPAETYAVYVTVTNYESAAKCQEVLYEVVDYLEVYDYYSESFAELTDEDIEMVTNVGIGIFIGVLVFFLVILVVIIVVIVVVVKSSKKKKAQRMAQQPQYNFDPRTGQPVQNNQNQPWQYNPYGQQPPVNNNQYNSYGQQGSQHAPYQPPVSETKDPLDLDNKE